jgi:stress-induced morphogen
MPMELNEIESLIREGIPGAQVTVEDLRGDGNHYSALVVSPTFSGKSRIEQHRMVYDALQGRMGEELHALVLQTDVPADA